jgi:hypothetical protein
MSLVGAMVRIVYGLRTGSAAPRANPLDQGGYVLR